MSDYKIRVANKAESNEVQLLLIELGLKKEHWEDIVAYFIYADFQHEYFSNDDIACFSSYDDCKETTLQQLRDLVVLKCNDVNDKNAEDGTFHDLYKTSDGVIYFYHHPKQEWTRSRINEKPEYLHLVKPIGDKQMTSHNIEQQAFNSINFSDEHMLKIKPHLYLDPTQNYAEIEWDGSFMKQDHWVEVPEGVNYLYKDNEHENTVFTVLEMGYRDSSIVWQRTQDEPFLTPESVIEREVNHKNVVQKVNEFSERLNTLEREIKRLVNNEKLERLFDQEVSDHKNDAASFFASASGSTKLMPRNNTESISIHGTIEPKPDFAEQGEQVLSDEQQRLLIQYPHYYKDVRHLAVVDVYEVLGLFGVTDQAVGHAVKKLLVTGKRGAKGRLQDLKEARDTLSRAIEIQERKND